MAEIDSFATLLIEESKRFLEKVSLVKEAEAKTAFLHSALLLAFCGLEAHISSVAEEFESRSDVSLYERSILSEREIRLDQGEIRLGGLKMYPLSERFLFIYHRFSGESLNRQVQWWADLSEAIVLRNKLTHPKEPQELTAENVKRAVKSVISAVDAFVLRYL